MFDEMNINRGDIYWCEFDGTFGSEQGGFRPCVIISNEKANLHSPVLTAIPLTTRKMEKKLPIHALIRSSNKISIALCEQIFTISRERLGDYIGACTEAEMKWIDNCLKIQLSLNERKTNYDKIKSMSVCELAELLESAIKYHSTVEFGVDVNNPTVKSIYSWLVSPSEG